MPWDNTEDGQIIRKNILPIGLGNYISGYEEDIYYNTNLLGVEVDVKKPETVKKQNGNAEVMGDFIRRQEMRDDYSNYFRYDNGVDDPLLLSFDITIDSSNSPLFQEMDKDVFKQNSLTRFIREYDILFGEREVLHKEFVSRLSEIFRIIPKPGFIDNSRPKSYYINKVDGMENFMKKIIDYKKDKLSVELQENVLMSNTYLSELYNNLVYSYRDQRNTAPENLLRFNMDIDLYEYRNYVIPYYSNNSYEYNFKESPKSIMKITLYDCNFDFSESKSWSQHITQAGLNAGVPRDFSFIDFNIFYKSIRRILTPGLIGDSYILDNRLAYGNDGKVKDKEQDQVNFDINKYFGDFENESKQNVPEAETSGGLSNTGGLLTNTANLGADKLKLQREISVKNYMDSQRQGLMRQLLDDVKDSINLERIAISLLDETPLGPYRQIILDGLNGNFNTLRAGISTFLTSEINKLRQQAFMSLYEGLYNDNINEGDLERLYLSQMNLNSEQLAILYGNTEIKPMVDDVVYQEGDPFIKPPDGVVYQEPGPFIKPPDGVVYQEPGPVIKPPHGVVYQEPGPIVKPPDGVVYTEPGPIVKPPDGVVYTESGPVVKNPNGVVYTESGAILKQPNGVVYTESGPILKQPNGVVYTESGPIVKNPIPPKVVYTESGPIVKNPIPPKVVYTESGPVEKHPMPPKVVYTESGLVKKHPDGTVYTEDENKKKTL